MNILEEYRNLFNLQGKVVLVSGGAISKGLASLGSNVIISGRESKKMEILAKRIIKAGGRANSYAVDIVDLKKIREFIKPHKTPDSCLEM